MTLQVLLELRNDIDNYISRLNSTKASLLGKEVKLDDTTDKYIIAINPELSVALTSNITSMFSYFTNPLQRLSIKKLCSRLSKITEILEKEEIVQIVPTLKDNSQYFEVLVLERIDEKEINQEEGSNV